MWSTVGAILLLVGTRWVVGEGANDAGWLIALGVVGGILKARFVLGRAARRIADRIRIRGDGRCIGGFLALRSWALVAVMAVGGRLLREGVVPRLVAGFVYTAIGAALLLASIRLWQGWYGENDRE